MVQGTDRESQVLDVFGLVGVQGSGSGEKVQKLYTKSQILGCTDDDVDSLECVLCHADLCSTRVRSFNQHNFFFMFQSTPNVQRENHTDEISKKTDTNGITRGTLGPR